ncbi:MAG: choice-of-anchor X domain-containing protein [Polyangia bacterium]
MRNGAAGWHTRAAGAVGTRRPAARCRLGFWIGLGLSLGPAAAAAGPRVCGGNAALGSFQPASCPELKDDGVPPDEAAGDGIYSVEVRLAAPVSAPLEYKLLPSGAFDGTELGSYRGSAGTDTCGLGGTGTNSFKNVQIPSPPEDRPVRFYYDSRVLSDPSHTRPPQDRSFGDDLMARSPSTACPVFAAVGDFQTVPFDRAVGSVALVQQRPGVLVGRWLATQSLAAGWKWQVQEKAPLGRRFGPGGWSYDPCTGDRVTVPSAVRIGDTVTFTFYASLGRLQTTVQAGGAGDLGAPEGPQCPPPVDMAQAGGTDAGPPPPSSDGAAGDLAAGDGGDGGDGGAVRPLPGIHCDCRLAGPGAAAGSGGWVAVAAGLLGLLLTARARRPLRQPLPGARGRRGDSSP